MDLDLAMLACNLESNTWDYSNKRKCNGRAERVHIGVRWELNGADSDRSLSCQIPTDLASETRSLSLGFSMILYAHLR